LTSPISELRGRLRIATWAPTAAMPFASDLHRVAERHLGPTVDLRHSFGDGRDFVPLLTEAGFRDVQVDTITRVVRGLDGPTHAQLNAMAIVGMSPAAKLLGDAERARLIDQVATGSLAVIGRFTGAAGFELDLATNIATARA
jgi:hypothetical protein